MISWLRATIPVEAAGVTLFAYTVIIAAPWVVFHIAQGQGPFQLFNELGLVLLQFLAAAYGVYRPTTTHPAVRPEYRRWLAGTPWRLGRPLPLGPVTLVPQDLLAVAALSGLAALHPESAPLGIPVIFFGAYLGSAVAAGFAIGYPVHAFLVSFGLGWVVLLTAAWPLAPMARVITVSAILMALYGIVWHGLRHGLARFRSWDLDRDDTWLRIRTQAASTEAIRKTLLGWPFDRLSPKRPATEISLTATAATACQVGWWYFVVASVLTRTTNPADLTMSMLGPLFPVVLGLACIRVGLYAWGHAPPISLWGRIVTFRWIIPGYDVVFLPSLAGIAMFLAGAWAMDEFRLSPLHAAPLLLGFEILLIVGSPPGLLAWKLTGDHRIIPAGGAGAELQQTP